MESLSSLATTLCSNGNRDASSSSSELSLSRCRLLGLLFVTDDDSEPSFADDFKLSMHSCTHDHINQSINQSKKVEVNICYSAPNRLRPKKIPVLPVAGS